MPAHFNKICFVVILLLQSIVALSQNERQQPVKIAIVGLNHDHVHWILGRKNRGDVEVVAIVEANRELVSRLARQYKFDEKMVYPSLDAMYARIKPEAVVTFTSIYDHLKVVEFCAPKSIHVMVEKPLAVSPEHARRMVALARQHHIQLMTNYETTWYGSNAEAYDLIKNKNVIGDIRRITFHTGHQGPVEIGCSKEFLAWLTDPVLNGGGAITDFGCYGANLATWLMNGEAPLSVFAETHTNKPDTYKKVDDDATIVLQYKKAQVVIQPSWCWPYNRKDMQVYGSKGYIFCNNGTEIVLKGNDGKNATTINAPALPGETNDPFSYFAGLIKGNIQQGAFDPSGLENNEMVVKILNAAKLSARSGKRVNWKDLK